MKPTKYDPMDLRFACCVTAIRELKIHGARKTPEMVKKCTPGTGWITCSTCRVCGKGWNSKYDFSSKTFGTPFYFPNLPLWKKKDGF